MPAKASTSKPSKKATRPEALYHSRDKPVWYMPWESNVKWFADACSAAYEDPEFPAAPKGKPNAAVNALLCMYAALTAHPKWAKYVQLEEKPPGKPYHLATTYAMAMVDKWADPEEDTEHLKEFVFRTAKEAEDSGFRAYTRKRKNENAAGTAVASTSQATTISDTAGLPTTLADTAALLDPQRPAKRHKDRAAKRAHTDKAKADTSKAGTSQTAPRRKSPEHQGTPSLARKSPVRDRSPIPDHEDDDLDQYMEEEEVLDEEEADSHQSGPKQLPPGAPADAPQPSASAAAKNPVQDIAPKSPTAQSAPAQAAGQSPPRGDTAPRSSTRGIASAQADGPADGLADGLTSGQADGPTSGQADDPASGQADGHVPAPTDGPVSGLVSTERFPGDNDAALAAAASTQAAPPETLPIHVHLAPVNTADPQAVANMANAATTSAQPAVDAQTVADKVMTAMRKHVTALWNKSVAVEKLVSREAERAKEEVDRSKDVEEVHGKAVVELLRRANANTEAINELRAEVTAWRTEMATVRDDLLATVRDDLLEQRQAIRDLQTAVLAPVEFEFPRRRRFPQLPATPPMPRHNPARSPPSNTADNRGRSGTGPRLQSQISRM